MDFSPCEQYSHSFALIHAFAPLQFEKQTKMNFVENRERDLAPMLMIQR